MYWKILRELSELGAVLVYTVGVYSAWPWSWEELGKECGSVFASMYGRFERYPNNASKGTFSQPNDKIPARNYTWPAAACCGCFCWRWLAAFAAAGCLLLLASACCFAAAGRCSCCWLAAPLGVLVLLVYWWSAAATHSWVQMVSGSKLLLYPACVHLSTLQIPLWLYLCHVQSAETRETIADALIYLWMQPQPVILTLIHLKLGGPRACFPPIHKNIKNEPPLFIEILVILMMHHDTGICPERERER